VYEPAVLASARAGSGRLVPEVPAPRLPRAQCKSSQWFECPCHGSQYNRVGEKKAGPAPRGMDHFAFTVSAGGDVVIDTGIIYQGLPIGTNTTGQEAEGPHCISGASPSRRSQITSPCSLLNTTAIGG
jgi:cytochrome b6-f complex iron-sulfur subunit